MDYNTLPSVQKLPVFLESRISNRICKNFSTVHKPVVSLEKHQLLCLENEHCITKHCMNHKLKMYILLLKSNQILKILINLHYRKF